MDAPQTLDQKSAVGFLRPEVVVGQFGVQKGWVVADFGCGSGHFSILIAQLVGPEGKVFAFDVRAEALEVARSRARLMGVGNVEYKRANVENDHGTSLHDVSVDLSLLANILFQSQKKESMFKEACRILKHGGTLVLIDWKKGLGMGHHGKGWELSAQEAKDMVAKLEPEMKFVKEFDAGQYHWGLIYKRV